MRILVTGGNGFIGRHVVASARRRGHTVRVLARRAADVVPGSLPDDSVHVVEHDLRVREGLTDVLRGMHAVIHCAASLSGGPVAQQSDTIDATRNLLAAMSDMRVGQLVGVSSFAVYDYVSLAAGATLDERSPLEENFLERGPYIRAKRQQEEMIRTQATSHGWRWAIVRPGLVYGPGRTWFHHLGMQLGGTRWLGLAGEALLPLAYVENCADAIVLALENESAQGATLNIVDDDLPTRRAYMEALAARTTPRPKVYTISWGTLNRTARSAQWVNRTVFRGRAPMPGVLTPASLHARCKPLFYPNERAKELLGWKPRVRMAEALQRST